MKYYLAILCVLAQCPTTMFGQTTILWNESVNGELSQDYSTATPLGSVQVGTNIIIGATEIEPVGQNWLRYPEDFSFRVPSGYEVTEVYIQIDKPNVWSWIGDSGFSNEMGFTMNSSTGNLLPQWGIGSISSGIYGVELTSLNIEPYTSIAHYELEFVVEAVPEPGTFGLLLLGAGVFTLRSGRKSRLLT